jgi:hypothetical protein
MGLFVLEVGEMERFVPQVGGHGPRWVNEVHERELHADEFMTAPREFVRSVVDSPLISRMS